MSQRITAYIRENYGEDVLAEVVAGKRDVELNGVVVDATAKNFRDKRVTDKSVIQISPIVGGPAIVNEPVDVLSEPVAPLLTALVDHTEIPEVKAPIDESLIVPAFPDTEIKVRTKRYYNALKHGKPAPEGAKVFTSKSGKQFYLKVVGEDRYITE